MAVNKIYPDAAAALTGILKDGMTVALTRKKQ
jgi:hypothetical protein